MDIINTLSPYLVPLATLIVGYFGEKGIKKLTLKKGEVEVKKAETEVESSKIADMEKSLKFWVDNSNEMRKELGEVQGKMDTMEEKFELKIKAITDEKDKIVEERESLKSLIIELRFERDEFKMLNDKLQETIERQDAKIAELEKFIQKQNMKISTLESKLQKYSGTATD